MPYKRHDIAEIEGVGQTRAVALRRLGIRSTEDLLLRPETHLRALVGRVKRFPVNRLAEFRDLAELMQIDGLTYNHADALYRAGYRNLTQLAAPEPAVIVRVLDAAAAKKLIPASVDAKTVLRWQKRALQIAYTGTLAGSVSDGDQPVAGATVICGFERCETDEGGGFHLPFVPAGKHRLFIRAEGFKRAVHKVDVRHDITPRYRFKLERGEDEKVLLDEAKGQWISRFDADDELVFEDTELADLPDGAPLNFRERYKRGNKVRLLGVYRRREGNRVIIPRLVVSGDLVEPNAAPGDVYYIEGNRLRKGGKKFKTLRHGLLLDSLKAQGVRAKLIRGKGVAR